MLKTKTLRVRNGKVYQKNSHNEWVRLSTIINVDKPNGVYKISICKSIVSANNYAQKLNSI